jgi:glycine/D-amino acid oxidase-like deaminating enzyme
MASNVQSCDIVIVGAGVFGLSAAIELKTRQPAAKITVLDPGPVPHRHAASTDISKVIRMDYGSDELYTEMMEASFPIWRQWNEEWKEQVYFETGLVGLVDSIPSGSFEDETIKTLRKRGHQIDHLDAETFKTKFPAWAEKNVGYFNPVAGWARSGLVLEHLNRICVASGINVQHGTVNRVLLKAETGGSVAEGVLTQDGLQIRAPLVIVAAGASTPFILPQVQHFMWPTAQPVFHFEIENPSLFPVEQFPVFFSSIAKTGFYGFPIIEEALTTKIAPRVTPTTAETKLSHRLKVGQHGPGWRVSEISDRSLSELWSKVGAVEEKKIRSWLHRALPSVAKAKIVYTRLCIYCDTFDGDFLIDHVPGVNGLVVASGGSGHGFKFAPVLGKVIADVVEKKSNPFKHRFAWREVVAGRKESSRHLNPDSVPQTLASL